MPPSRSSEEKQIRCVLGEQPNPAMVRVTLWPQKSRWNEIGECGDEIEGVAAIDAGDDAGPHWLCAPPGPAEVVSGVQARRTYRWRGIRADER